MKWTDLNPEQLIQHIKDKNPSVYIDAIEEFMKRVSVSFHIYMEVILIKLFRNLPIYFHLLLKLENLKIMIRRKEFFKTLIQVI